MTGYIKKTRFLAFGMPAILPLIVFYEIMVKVQYREMILDVRNSAELFLKDFFAAFGLNDPIILLSIYITATGIAIYFARKSGYVFPRYYAIFLVVIESMVYAAFLGSVTRFITNQLLRLQTGLAEPLKELLPQILMAVSAGVYEEILFRLIMLGFLLLLLRQLMQSKRWLQIATAVFVSSVIFSVFHYASYEYFTWSSFTFRFVAGCILGLLFVHRGLAVAVYTHAFYDFFFFLQSGNH